MRRQISIIILICVFGALGICNGVPIYGKDKKTEEALNAAAQMFEEIMQVPERALPQESLGACRCVLILPETITAPMFLAATLKGGFGFMTCRTGETNEWSTPEIVRIIQFKRGPSWPKGGVGLIFLAMTPKATDLLASGSIKLGADATVAPGAIGWTASAAPASPPADFQAWAVQKGVISGVEIESSTLSVDRPENRRVRFGPPTIKPLTREQSQRLLAVVERYATPVKRVPVNR